MNPEYPLQTPEEAKKINGTTSNTANSTQPRTAITLRELLTLLPDDVYVQVLPFSYHEYDIIPIDADGEAGSKSFLKEAEPLVNCTVRHINPISLDVDKRASSQALEVWIDSPSVDDDDDDDDDEQPAH